MKTFVIKTYGCSSNLADSNIMRNLLIESGWQENMVSDADYVIVNTCAVKNPTENKIIDYINSLKQPRSNIVLAGCLPADKKFRDKYEGCLFLNPYNIHRILDLIMEKAVDNSIYLEPTNFDKTKLGAKPEYPVIISPSIGCFGNCTYCRTKFAKPVFRSYPLENILDRIDNYINQGVKEIWISSEDNGVYGRDVGLSFMDLLHSIEDRFAGRAMFRFGMANPGFLLEHMVELVEFFQITKAFYKFLHIPIQSASDAVLSRMMRPYTAEKLNELFDSLTNTFLPEELTISTDVIVGFPGETDVDFILTKDFLQTYKPLIINISQFSSRPHTKAKLMTQLPSEIKKDRSRILTRLCRKNIDDLLAEYRDKKIEIYPHKIDSNGNTLARTRNYVSVIVPNIKLVLFKWQTVKVKATENNHLLVE